MRRKRLLVIVCAVIAVLIAVIVISVNSGPDGEHLPILVKWEIETAWSKQLDRPFEQWFDSSTFRGVRYYGEYNGYHILFDDTGIRMMVYGGTTIAGEEFEHSTPFDLYAYKDGVFLTLAEAYEQGLISKEQIALIAECHRNIHKTS